MSEPNNRQSPSLKRNRTQKSKDNLRSCERLERIGVEALRGADGLRPMVYMEKLRGAQGVWLVKSCWYIAQL